MPKSSWQMRAVAAYIDLRRRPRTDATPAAAAAMAISACIPFGVATSMTSISGRSMTLRHSVEISSHPQVADIFSRPARLRPQITFNCGAKGRSKK